MVISLDFDDTYTLDPEFWNAVIALAKERGHKIFCVTARRDTPENREDLACVPAAKYFTGLSAKKWFMEERGWDVDVWIDDRPDVILNGV